MEDYCGLTKARQHTVNAGSWGGCLPGVIFYSWYVFDFSYL